MLNESVDLFLLDALHFMTDGLYQYFLGLLYPFINLLFQVTKYKFFLILVKILINYQLDLMVMNKEANIQNYTSKLIVIC